MTILFILLLDTAITGLQLHELIGIGIFVLFIIHKLLNYKWIIAVTKNIFGKKTKLKTRIMYILDVLILMAVTLTVLSGIFISKSLFTWIIVSNTAFWKTIHSPVAYLSFILISIHLGLHWQYIMAAFRKMFKFERESLARKRVLRIFALVLAIAGIKSSIENNIAGKIVTPLISGSSNTESQKETLSSSSTSSAQSTQTVTSASDNITSAQSTQTVTNTETASSQTLEQYLGSLFCTGCGKHCLLLYPQCSIGEQQAEEATADYNAGNTTSSSSSTSSSSTQTQSATTSQPNSAGKGKGGHREEQNAGSSETRPENNTTSNSAQTTNNSTVTVYTSASQVAGIFGEYIPIMGVWVLGVHYLVLALDKKKK